MIKDNENAGNLIVRPIGIVRNNNSEPSLVAGNEGIKMKEQHKANMKQIRQINEEISEIIIDNDIIDILEGVEKYSHLIILYLSLIHISEPTRPY